MARGHVVNVMLRDAEGRLLLLERTGTTSHVGEFSSPGGGLEDNEDIRSGAARELFEETGAVVAPEDLRLVSVIDRRSKKDPSLWVVEFFFDANRWQGSIFNKEPHKHGEPTWYALDNLPEKISPFEKEIVRRGFQPDLILM